MSDSKAHKELVEREYACEATDVDTPLGKVLRAKDSEGAHHLLVPLESKHGFQDDLRSRGVQLASRTLVHGGKEQSFADLHCRIERLKDVYLLLVEEVLDACREGAEPLKACRETLGRWRDLLDRAGGSRLGLTQLTGLFGELFVLRELAKIDAEAVGIWTGPTGGVHDFVGENHSIEVKTSRELQGLFAKISNERQLERLPGRELALAYLQVEILPSGGESVPELVKSLHYLLNDNLELHRRLGLIGYNPAEAESYEDTRFTLVNYAYYRVGDDFPRITASSFPSAQLPLGVQSLSYQVDLSVAEQFVVPEAEHSSVLSSLLGA